jgi:hypothetical protein
VIVPKTKNEPLGVVIVESGWGSMLPTVVIANMMPGGPAARLVCHKGTFVDMYFFVVD